MTDDSVTDHTDPRATLAKVQKRIEAEASKGVTAESAPASETTTETVEWNVVSAIDGEPYLQPWTTDRSEAEEFVDDVQTLVRRTRVSTADVVGEWEEIR